VKCAPHDDCDGVFGVGGRMTAAFCRRTAWQLPRLPVAGAVLALAIANVWFTAWTIAEMALTYSAADWSVIVRAAALAGSPDLYRDGGPATYPWSPLLAYAFLAIAPMGLVAWRLLHIAAALALPTWRLRLLVLVSWPFWFDFSLGNVLTFVFLAAVWALKGSRIAIVLLFVLVVLFPRPVALPVIVWILWRRPQWRLPFAAVAIASVLGAGLTGLADDWVHELLIHGSRMTDWLFNVGPSRLIGLWWLPIGLTLSIWLTWRGRLGWASLAVSPYLLPYYLMFGFLEIAPRTEAKHEDAVPGHNFRDQR
jgi:hypothetical protein